KRDWSSDVCSSDLPINKIIIKSLIKISIVSNKFYSKIINSFLIIYRINLFTCFVSCFIIGFGIFLSFISSYDRINITKRTLKRRENDVFSRSNGCWQAISEEIEH